GDEELHVADLGLVNGGMINLVEDTVRTGKPDSARGGVGGADGVLDTGRPAWRKARRTEGFALLVKPTIEAPSVHCEAPIRISRESGLAVRRTFDVLWL